MSCVLSVAVWPSPLSGTRRIVECIFSYTKPQHRLHREVLRPLQHGRGISVAGDEAVAQLQPIGLERRMK